MKTLKTLLAVSVLALSANVSADVIDGEWSFGLETGLFTHHVDETEPGFEYNEQNGLIGFELSKGDFALQYSEFNNSYGVDSWSAGVSWEPLSFSIFDIGVAGGIVSGYDAKYVPTPCVDGLCIYVAPTIVANIAITDDFAIVPTVRMFGTAIVGSVKAEYKF